MELLIGVACVVFAALVVTLFLVRQRPVCDVCGAEVDPQANACTACGADFTNEDREYHTLS